ncbi:MAG TPA: adenylate/guanylate cyclase domain-containing protein [Nitrosopumilaceae archaeon]|nr:adenylate/guanylate cyclase domain-containing protein [Nitrosopumilaceae archaeon]
MDEQTTMNFFGSDKEEESPKVGEGHGDVISFSEIYESYCVGIVDIKDSTRITSILSKPKICQYYTIFLNSMAFIIRKHGGIVVKNIGDSLLYYFPKTFYTTDRTAFEDSLECGMSMIDAHSMVNSKMSEEGLPVVNYRISSDYGLVMTAKSENSTSKDIFGPTINLCSKINSLALPNTMVIGGDLYQTVKSLADFRFTSISEYNNGLKLHYPVYSISRHKP